MTMGMHERLAEQFGCYSTRKAIWYVTPTAATQKEESSRVGFCPYS